MAVTVKTTVHEGKCNLHDKSLFMQSQVKIFTLVAHSAEVSISSMIRLPQCSFSHEMCREQEHLRLSQRFRTRCHRRIHAISTTNLTTRPEECLVCSPIAILSCWLNRHAKEIRDMFVCRMERRRRRGALDKDSQMQPSSRSVFGDFAKQTTRLIEQHIEVRKGRCQI